ncbi:VOC family protein [Nesterenkonia haasae]|uniref:VOC family protein n=1 Tax=Nesterenkonia haasae TaxID=2587813 RepID=UPI001391CE98|nr:VOC family protein [Nesterenkonia haasae]NDK30295.1 glyoxalase [Nesterenkonia haasae]
MVTTSFYPVLMSSDVPAAADFYRGHLGFETVYDSSWYVSLRLGAFELALLAREHETVPASHQALPQGVILNLEVDDVDAFHERLKAIPSLRTVQPLRSEDFGQRHFILEGPDRVLIDVIQPIEPTTEFMDSYREQF